MKKRKVIFLTAVGLGDDEELPIGLLVEHINANNLGIVKSLPIEVLEGFEFSDRVKIVYSNLKASIKEGYDVYLIGNSAGALACLIAASKLGWWHWRLNRRLKGVIAISPATPRWNNPLSWSLVWQIRGYWRGMLTGKLMDLSDQVYENIALNSGISHEARMELQDAKLSISGKEARTLAGIAPWFRPLLRKVRTNVLIVSGDKDNWVKPKAHKKLFGKLHDFAPSGCIVAWYQFSGLAHILIPSERGEEVVIPIISWINKPTSGMKTKQ